MNSNYNAAVQSGSSTSAMRGTETKGVSNPLKNRMTIPPREGVMVSKACYDAMRGIALAQINIGNNLRYR